MSGPEIGRVPSYMGVPYQSEDGKIDLRGRDWMYEPRTWRDVLRCRLGRHRAVMYGWIDYFDYRERCSCGAMGTGRYWVCLDKQAGRRAPTTKGS